MSRYISQHRRQGLIPAYSSSPPLPCVKRASTDPFNMLTIVIRVPNQ